MPPKGKRPYRRTKRITAKLYRSLAVKADEPKVFILKNTYTIASNLSGIINTTLQPTSVTGYPDFSALSQLYDSYEVLRLKKQLQPIRVGDESAVAGSIRGNIVSFIDNDGTGLPTTILGAVEYANSLKFYGARTAMKRSLSIEKIHRGKLNDFAGPFDVANNDNMHICFLGENFGPSQNQYYVIDTIWLKCYCRR